MRSGRLSWRRLIRLREQCLTARPGETVNQTSDRLTRALAITEQLRAASRCQRCGRKLEAFASVENGVGPECIKHDRAAVAS